MKQTKQFDLDTPLLTFSDDSGKTEWTIRSACEGVFIAGSIGGGKSSGPGRTIILRYLSAGFGGLVLTAKADEVDNLREYCRLTGRLDDLIVIEQGGKHSFNFLEYESAHRVGGISITQNLVQILRTIIQARDDKGGGIGNDMFWQAALDILMTRILQLGQLAYGKVNVLQLFSLVRALPKKEDDDTDTSKTDIFREAFDLAQKNVNKQLDVFNGSLTETQKKAFEDDPAKRQSAIMDAIPDAATLGYVYDFFNTEYRNLSEKTRSVIEFSYISFLSNLVQEPFYSHFCRYPSTVTPEDSLRGKIIVVNFPVKQYNEAGQSIQVMVKYCWQRAMERRNLAENDRPVFLYADEAQLFMHPSDTECQATSRSSRVASVFLTQNIHNLHANMGGAKYEHKVLAFLGTIGTKIFNCNVDYQTNFFASQLIGQDYFEDRSINTHWGKEAGGGHNRSYKLEYIVRPEEFATLSKGGPKYDFLVEAYMHMQGDTFHDGQNHRKVIFKQK